ncbi:MAG: hypothetical protein ACI9KE_000780 [Polyangiales bacterium]
MKRRNVLKTLALGAAGVSLSSIRGGVAAGQDGAAPKRVVFWTTQHGPPRNTWKMSPPGLGATGSASLAGLAPSDFSRVYEPLHRVRESVSIIDGLSMMSAMIDRSGSANNHGVSWANLLVNVPYNSDDPFVGTRTDNLHPRPGGISIDQYIGQSASGGRRLDSVVWSDGGGRFGSQFAFSANDLGQWIVPNRDPMNAFARLMGTGLLVTDDPGGPVEPPPLTREDRIRAARFRAYNLALTHFDRIAPQLSTADQESLVAHRNQLERLGVRFDPGGGGTDPGGGSLAMCRPDFSATGDTVDDFFRLATVALACDAVRVITMDARQLSGSQIGASDADDVHQAFAHGTNDRATMMMENYYRYHADQFANFVEYLRSVPEGSGTLLDNTLVIWIPELSTGGHMFDESPTVIAGGGATGFSPGRYIRYAQDIPAIGCGYGCQNSSVGPGRMRLFVNAMRHMGMSDNSFGRTSTMAGDGSTIDLSGPLSLIS